MRVCVYGKDYFKASADVRKAVLYGAEELYRRICCYENENVEFDMIFNDDKVKYDKHGKFYTYKFQRFNMQLRILYAYLKIDGVPTILIADFFVKKRTSKIYINKFDSANTLEPMDLYRESTEIYSN